jgi:hypothetical protein
MKKPEAAQTLVIFALLLPLVLLPIASYAIQATLLASRASLLQASVARAAEDGAQAVDVAGFRSSGVLRLDAKKARQVAGASLAEQDRLARLDGVEVGPTTVTVRAHDEVPLGFGGILSAGTASLAAVATARLTLGYRNPSCWSLRLQPGPYKLTVDQDPTKHKVFWTTCPVPGPTGGAFPFTP